MNMKLKTVEVGGKVYAEVSDGKPVYVNDDGKDSSFDVPDMYARLTRDGKRNAELQKSFEDAQAKLKNFDGINPEAARKAIELTHNIDESKLLSAGKVEEIKAAAKKAAEDQVAAANKAAAEEHAKQKAHAEKLEQQLHSVMIGGGFSRAKMITDEKHPMRLAIPADIAEARFGKNFKVEEGRVVGYDQSGNKIFSKSKPGDLADFDEALETLVDQYPYKDQIVRGAGNRGDSAKQNNGNGSANGKTMSRAEFEKLAPVQQMQKMSEQVVVVD